MSVIEEIAAERKRQGEVERFRAAHDDEHVHGELARAGACYAMVAGAAAAVMAERGETRELSHYSDTSAPKGVWPWAKKWWKPKTRRHDLVGAAALIVAEIERLDRLAGNHEVKK